MKIFLCGYMGSGKTTIGKKLALKLGYPFFDLDHYLSEKYKQSISNLFKSIGESQFRIRESEALKETENMQNTVISTGGGTPCFFDNMDWMNQHGKTIYLKLDPKTLAQRVSANTERPLLAGLSGDDLLKFISEKLEEREHYYSKAQLIVDGIGLNAERLHQLISANTG